MADQTVKEMLKMIDVKINHIEDITADNRTIIIKLVKQGNDIVQFLKQLELQEADDMIDEYQDISFERPNLRSSEKMGELKELLSQFKDRQQDLKEFEEELKKHKDELTPGQVGDA